MIVRGAFNHLLRPGLRRDFRDSYEAFPEEFPGFLEVGSQDRAEVEATTLTGLPRMVQRGEVEPITYLDPVMGDKFTFLDDEFALGFQVSKKMMEDDLYGKANQNSKWLARSARLTQEYQAAALLDDAFVGNVFTGDNDESLISSSHYLLGGSGTWSNTLSNPVQLSVTGVQAMMELAEALVDQNGDPIPGRVTKLVCDLSDEWAAIAITQTEKEPYTAENQVNAIMRKRANLSYMVSHYKTQGGEWFGIDPMLSDAHFLFRVRPELDDTFDFDTKAAKFSTRQRINVYFFDPRGWWGCNP